eukprot:1230318-Alexandrium_andersonii.AAC.1
MQRHVATALPAALHGLATQAANTLELGRLAGFVPHPAYALRPLCSSASRDLQLGGGPQSRFCACVPAAPR